MNPVFKWWSNLTNDNYFQVYAAIQRVSTMEFELDPTIMLITSGIGVLVNIMYVLLNLPFALKKLWPVSKDNFFIMQNLGPILWNILKFVAAKWYAHKKGVYAVNTALLQV